MKRSKLFFGLFSATALCATLLLTSCGKDDDVPPPPPPVVTNTITDRVVADASLSLLRQAVVKADLAATLSGAGPFTVFAPDDAAFTSAGFTSPVIASAAVTPAALRTILLYHTIPSRILAAQVPAGPNAKVITAGGDSVFVTRNAAGVFVNGVRVTVADIAADNGVIHKVGRVINPPTGNIVQTAIAAGLDSLVKAVLRATNAPGGDPTLAGTLSNATLTVFAPTNAAFTQLLGILGVTDINQIPVATLLAVLRYHVVGGRAFSSDLANGSLTMLAGGTTTVNVTGAASIRGTGNGGSASNITATDIMCRNGVVHLIDRVLRP